ncbi:MAG: hypothetical protein EZS28_036903, partial [Streblomastix strix]
VGSRGKLVLVENSNQNQNAGEDDLFGMGLHFYVDVRSDVLKLAVNLIESFQFAEKTKESNLLLVPQGQLSLDGEDDENESIQSEIKNDDVSVFGESKMALKDAPKHRSKKKENDKSKDTEIENKKKEVDPDKDTKKTSRSRETFMGGGSTWGGGGMSVGMSIGQFSLGQQPEQGQGRPNSPGLQAGIIVSASAGGGKQKPGVDTYSFGYGYGGEEGIDAYNQDNDYGEEVIGEFAEVEKKRERERREARQKRKEELSKYPTKLLPKLDELLYADQPKDNAAQRRLQQQQQQLQQQQALFPGDKFGTRQISNIELLRGAEQLECPTLIFYILSHWVASVRLSVRKEEAQQAIQEQAQKALQRGGRAALLKGDNASKQNSQVNEERKRNIFWIKAKGVVAAIASCVWLESLEHTELVLLLKRYNYKQPSQQEIEQAEQLLKQPSNSQIGILKKQQSSLLRVQAIVGALIIASELMKDVLWYVRFVQHAVQDPFPSMRAEMMESEAMMAGTVVKKNENADQGNEGGSVKQDDQKKEEENLSRKQSIGSKLSGKQSQIQSMSSLARLPIPRYLDREGRWEVFYSEQLFSQILSQFAPYIESNSQGRGGSPTRFPPSSEIQMAMPNSVETIRPWLPERQNKGISQSQSRGGVSLGGLGLGSGIEVLDLRFISNMTAVDVAAQCCPKVKCIDLRGVKCISAPTIVRLSRLCNNLELILLGGSNLSADDGAVIAIEKSRPSQRITWDEWIQ